MALLAGASVHFAHLRRGRISMYSFLIEELSEVGIVRSDNYYREGERTRIIAGLYRRRTGANIAEEADAEDEEKQEPNNYERVRV